VNAVNQENSGEGNSTLAGKELDKKILAKSTHSPPYVIILAVLVMMLSKAAISVSILRFKVISHAFGKDCEKNILLSFFVTYFKLFKLYTVRCIRLPNSFLDLHDKSECFLFIGDNSLEQWIQNETLGL